MLSCSVSPVVRRLVQAALAAVLLLSIGATQARALDRLCDPASEDCRAILINYIRNENVGIDVGFWFMEDARYTTELIAKWQAGVPVRVIMDTRANATNQFNAQRLAELQAAGIPLRTRFLSGIMHYKLMLFAGQGIVEFSGANFSADAWRPADPYVNYVDESVYFTDNPSFVGSFKSKYDDLWTDTATYKNYANVTTLSRSYGAPGTFVKDPQLNFPPAEAYATRAVGRYNKETQKIDVIMYRITDRRHSDAMIAAKTRGVAVRLISDPQQYRDDSRLWDAWNVDRMYMAGIPIRMRAHAGLNHQKLVMLYSQSMAIFGSSNWTSPSNASQEEHNCFCTDPTMFQWFVDMFERKWNNSNPVGSAETGAFVPLPPDKPSTPSPANLATGIGSSVVLKWFGGPWAHKYDVLMGTSTTDLKLVLADQELGPSESPTEFQTFAVSNLLPGTTYYWQVVSRTMANKERVSELWNFTTAGSTPPPAPTGTTGPGDILLYARDGQITGTKWSIVADQVAAGAQRLWNKNASAPKLTTALANPTDYVEFTFQPVAGQPYHLWMRGRADGDVYINDSVFVQFSNAVNGSTPIYQIGTTSATEYNLEDCGGCGLLGWGWQDNGWGVGVSGPDIFFDSSEPQTLRIQAREDGLSIDQILLSPSLYRPAAPGALKNDTTIYAATQGPSASGEPPPPPPPPPPTTGLPTGWTNQDIGAVGATGSASYTETSQTFTINGAGADVWGTADAFQYAYRTLTGDGTITARVATVSNTAAWVKAGVMIRSTLTADSAHGFMLVSASKGLAFQRRTTTGGISTSTAGAVAPTTAPYWVRVSRVGDTITASQSPDGQTWTDVGTDTIPMGADVFIGLGVSSHTTAAAAPATFDNVIVTGG